MRRITYRERINGLSYLKQFWGGYISCAFWASSDESDDKGGQPLDANYSTADLGPGELEEMMTECADFVFRNRKLLRASKLVASQAGHDFWLTRNGHGAGFWDRDLGDIGDALSEACKEFGECNLYVGDDDKVYAD